MKSKFIEANSHDSSHSRGGQIIVRQLRVSRLILALSPLDLVEMTQSDGVSLSPPKLCWSAASFALEELAEIGGLVETQLLSDGDDRHVQMH